MPLYLFAIGAFLKSWIIHTVTLQLAASSYEAKDTGRVLRNLEHEKQREEIYEALRLTEDEEQEHEGRIWESETWIKAKYYATVTWELYLIGSMLTQAGFDIWNVSTASTSSKWERYDCFVLVMLNSPNVSTLFPSLPGGRCSPLVFMPSWYFSTLDENETIPPFRRTRQQLASVLWTALIVTPCVTHVIPFVFPIYFWVTGVAILALSLFVFLHRTFKPVDPKTFGNIGWNLFRAVGPSLHSVFISSLIPVGASTMVQWYRSPENYIGSLKETLADRSIRAYINYEILEA
eukprot:gb/GECG01001178.1/.p1 GENE.gb/GECG01001178.1/~~gb/GECG01001178.1/.p1  ORF type:complete len:291 (+),score=25.58 gb/GECG01001178.1/:1-873(+)